MNKKKHVISIGLKGFPYGMAPIQKLLMMGKAFIESGNAFTVISNSYVKRTKLNIGLKRLGNYGGIDYICSCPYLYTPESLIAKIFGRYSGKIREILLILKLKRNHNLDAVVIYSNKFFYTLCWSVFLRILKCPVYLIYVELRSNVTNRAQWHLRLNDILYDRFVFYAFNGIFTLSDNLIRHFQKFVPDKRYLYVPPLIDFKVFKKDKDKEAPEYFLFCGSLAYLEVIEFIIRSYQNIDIDHHVKLYLVISGSQSDKNKVAKLITELNLENHVEIFTDLTQDELMDMYVSAKALLIPLRNTLQDVSRFPNKIAEYCAAHRPIVATRIGELPKFFDNTSAIFAENYCIDEFSNKLKFVIENPAKCEEIAANSYAIGLRYFNYKEFTNVMYDFMFPAKR